MLAQGDIERAIKDDKSLYMEKSDEDRYVTSQGNERESKMRVNFGVNGGLHESPGSFHTSKHSNSKDI